MEIMEESKNCSEKEEEEEEDMMSREESKQAIYPFLFWFVFLLPIIELVCKILTTRSQTEISGFSHQDAAAINFNTNIDLMDLSLGTKDIDEAAALIHGGGRASTSAVGASGSSSSSRGTNYNYTINTDHESIEKEHMFDKVVTPSDVGKLNRLVIPKQHAEKYFPLDSSSNDKGLLLNFEDKSGKSWRFRYSYWNSSQSYVMTKGWSRFVKEKKLDAGDIVSFQRGLGDVHKYRLFIDWRRRPDHAATDFMSPLLISNHPHLSPYSIRWSGRLYSLPQPLSMSLQHYEHMQQMNYNFHPYYHQYQQQQHRHYHYDPHCSGRRFNEVSSESGSLCCFSSPNLQTQAARPADGGEGPMVIDSVPIAHHNNSRTTSKKLRLFGVNMECSPAADEEPRCHILSSTIIPPHVNVTMTTNSVPPHLLPSYSHLPLQLRFPHGGATTMPSSYSQARFQEKGESSMPFDLDPSMKYFL